MGTNYDWQAPGIHGHIGKVSTVYNDEANKLISVFTWDADPVQTMYLLRTLTGCCVVDEYGRQRTGPGMLGVILRCEQDYSSIGQNFS